LALTLVVVLFAGFLPVGAGLALISTPRHVEFSLDLCHPLQAFDTVQSVPMARLSSPVVEFVRLDFGIVSDVTPPTILRPKSPPESPPPEPMA